MIDSFKNFERLRYRLSNDMRELASDSKESSDKLMEQIANTVFATIFSAFITKMAFGDGENGYNICMILKMIVLFVFIYVVSFVLYSFLYRKILKKWQERKIHSINSGMSAMIQIQKDFDNIACDSILMARGYKSAYEKLPDIEENQNLKVFYYYEIMHYMDVACDKTRDLVKHKKDCIRTMNEAIGVDIFRVINIKNIMEEMIAFLNEKYIIVCDQDNQKEAVEYQLAQLETKIETIKKGIN